MHFWWAKCDDNGDNEDEDDGDDDVDNDDDDMKEKIMSKQKNATYLAGTPVNTKHRSLWSVQYQSRIKTEVLMQALIQ